MIRLQKKQLTLHISDYVKSHYNVSKENFFLTYAQFSSPFPAKILDIFAQGVVLFSVVFLIDKRKIYNRKYWILALLLTQLEHNMSNSNISFTPDVAARTIILFGAMIIGYIALLVSMKIVKKRTNSLSDQP
jgi:hypothetical protein